MKTFGAVSGSVFAVALLLGLLAAGYLLFKYVANAFATLPPQMATLAGIASGVALLCAVIIAEGLKARGRRDERSSDAGVHTYERLLRLCSEQHPADSELAEIERLLALHGSSRVVAAYVKLRSTGDQDGKTEAAALLSRLLIEMRSDLGRTERLRNQGDFMGLLCRRS